jgi:hypothetical protein
MLQLSYLKDHQGLAQQEDFELKATPISFEELETSSSSEYLSKFCLSCLNQMNHTDIRMINFGIEDDFGRRHRIIIRQ